MPFKKMNIFLKNYKIVNFETKLFFFSSLILFILNFIYLNANNETTSYIILLVLVAIFGLPHGALDTIKKNIDMTMLDAEHMKRSLNGNTKK